MGLDHGYLIGLDHGYLIGLRQNLVNYLMGFDVMGYISELEGLFVTEWDMTEWDKEQYPFSHI